MTTPEDADSCTDGLRKGADPFNLENVFPSTAGLFLSYRVGSGADANVLVAFDTNALLLPYKLGKDDLSALADVYHKLAHQKRLFAPARSIREFVKHRDQKLAEIVKGLNDKHSRISVAELKLSPLLDGVSGYSELEAAARAMETAYKTYKDMHAKLVEQIRAWRGDDPVTTVYKDVFTASRIIEHDGENKDVLKEWETRLNNNIPPGYKDAKKADSGIGDFLIWKALLWLGKEHKKDLIFITGEEKPDWFVRSGGEPLYPRPELVDEYRRASGNKNIRLSSLHDLLSEMKAPTAVVDEVRVVEGQANTAIRVSKAASAAGLRQLPLVQEVSFDYSTNDGIVSLGKEEVIVNVRFSKASDTKIHLYRARRRNKVARARGVAPGEIISIDDFDTSSASYTISIGELFLVQNPFGDTLAGRILEISDDSRGAERDSVTFRYSVFPTGECVVAP